MDWFFQENRGLWQKIKISWQKGGHNNGKRSENDDQTYTILGGALKGRRRHRT